MANADRPNGFRAVKTLSGAPVSAMIRAVGVADAADIFVGDPLDIVGGLAGPAAAGAPVVGVAVGFGKKNTMQGIKGNAYGDPANMNSARFYDDSANTHTDWVVYYVPAEDVVFEAQTDGADTLLVGEEIDMVAGAGSETTGLSGYEIDAGVSTNDDLIVVEIPDYVDNDPTLAAGRYWVIFKDVEFGRT